MKSFHNIEKSGFRRGEYIGWSGLGMQYRIVKRGDLWCAIPVTMDASYSCIYKTRLADISSKLESIK